MLLPFPFHYSNLEGGFPRPILQVTLFIIPKHVLLPKVKGVFVWLDFIILSLMIILEFHPSSLHFSSARIIIL